MFATQENPQGIDSGDIVWAPITRLGVKREIRVLVITIQDGRTLVVKLPGDDAGLATVEARLCQKTSLPRMTLDEAWGE